MKIEEGYCTELIDGDCYATKDELVDQFSSSGLADVKQYKCKECGYITTQDNMLADHWIGDDCIWSNWICPKCNQWPGSLEDGWDLIA